MENISPLTLSRCLFHMCVTHTQTYTHTHSVCVCVHNYIYFENSQTHTRNYSPLLFQKSFIYNFTKLQTISNIKLGKFRQNPSMYSLYYMNIVFHNDGGANCMFVWAKAQNVKLTNKNLTHSVCIGTVSGA